MEERTWRTQNASFACLYMNSDGGAMVMSRLPQLNCRGPGLEWEKQIYDPFDGSLLLACLQARD